MTRLPDNLKCVLHNGGYYTHWVSINVNKTKAAARTFTISCLHVSSEYAAPHSGLLRDYVCAELPPKDVKSIPTLLGFRKPGIECFEILFKDLPENVKNRFREFEHMLVQRHIEKLDICLQILKH